MKRAVYLALVLLAILHQDVWYWDDPTLVLGFLPIGLAYHLVYSIATAVVWCLALKYAWPEDLESYAVGKEIDEVRPR
jgi:hypothetical protein